VGVGFFAFSLSFPDLVAVPRVLRLPEGQSGRAALSVSIGCLSTGEGVSGDFSGHWKVGWKNFFCSFSSQLRSTGLLVGFFALVHFCFARSVARLSSS